MASVIEAVVALSPTSRVSVNANDVEQIHWQDGNPNNITTEQILAKLSELQALDDTKAYARKRAEEYPSTKDFMEAYTEKEIGGDSTKWDAYIIKYNKVRSDNPKG